MHRLSERVAVRGRVGLTASRRHRSLVGGCLLARAFPGPCARSFRRGPAGALRTGS